MNMGLLGEESFSYFFPNMGVVLGTASEKPAFLVAGVKHLQTVADIVNKQV